MKKYSAEEKVMWIDDWRQSGKNVWTYARENGLVPQTFMNWINPRKREAKQSLVEVPKQVIQSSFNLQEILIEKGDMRIHIPIEPVLNELHKVIARLGQK